ncbi:MAG TPA: ABC transporter substrate-binding protein [Thermoplasmata archaeon]|jgi:ABC-type transport system substrate-binding protein|nr:ABC transporter substrate-binding protein [Thermoplasmata archaeon]
MGAPDFGIATPRPLSRDAPPPARTVAHRAALAGILVALLLSTFPSAAPPARASSDPTLRVGVQDEMKTRNLLPAIASDVWTTDVLFRVYESPIRIAADGATILPYIAKGVDFDEDGVFEPSEYAVWGERRPPSTALQAVVYYDFNGVHWHDGTQVTPWDLLFSYHVNAMNPRFNTNLRVLFCAPGVSYEPCNRQLAVEVLAARTWVGEGDLPGDPALRVAVRFVLNEPFALFYESTLAPLLVPMHLWSRTGGSRHADFGCAIWVPPAEATAKAIPECRNADSAVWGDGIPSTTPVPGSGPYEYPLAEGWGLRDEDVVGSGPFRFLGWTPGVETRLARYDGYLGGVAYDAKLAKDLHRPRLEGIVYKAYKTTQLGVFALNSGEIDFYHWNVPPEFVPDLLKNPSITVESNADFGLFYMGYNFRREPWGYRWTNGTREDIGYWLRQAVSHLVDRSSLVANLLQNFGVPDANFVSPSNTFWYNPYIPTPAYDLDLARQVLDSPEARAAGIGPDPPGWCYGDVPSGCRTLPGIGTARFEILTPHADYDAVRASAGAMIANAMREVGLNAAARPMAFGEIVDRIVVHDFDLFILGWRITGGGDPSDYLFSFFACSPGFTYGPNLLGYCSPALDAVLDEARRETDRLVRRGWIFQAQAILASDRPAEVLYYRTNIEAYRADRFVNWTVAGGTIWNDWSLFGIRPPGEQFLTLGIDAETGVLAGSETTLLVRVRGPRGDVVGSATVAVSLSSPSGEDPGILLAGSSEGIALVLETGPDGDVAVRYRAPVFFEATRPVFVKVAASHPAYLQGATEETVLTVYGPDLAFLRVRIDFPVGDLGNPGVPFPARIVVRDRDGAPVPDARVEVQVQPAGIATPSAGSSEEMQQIVLVFPSTGTYSIGLSVTAFGHRDAWAVVTVWVLPPPPSSRPDIPPARGFDDTGVKAALVVLAAAVTLTSVVAGRLLLRHRGRGRG